MLETVFAARSLKPPSDSKTSGTKDTPTAWHGEACIAIFLFSPTAMAWPDVRAAPWRVSGCKVEMTVTSSAVGRPLSQLGRKMSAGRAWEPGIRDGNSFLGAKAAV